MILSFGALLVLVVLGPGGGAASSDENLVADSAPEVCHSEESCRAVTEEIERHASSPFR